MKASGFTITELAVVILILAIIAGAVCLRTGSLVRRTEMTDVVGQIVAFEAASRRYAMEHDTAVHLRVRMQDSRIGRIDTTKAEPLGCDLYLPDGFSIARLLVRGQDLSEGEVHIRCSSRGLTPSYALLVESKQGHRQWLLVAGLTGQITRMDNEKHVREILARPPERPDVG